MLEPVLARVDRDFDAAIERWSELLRIPSISTDPDHADDMRRAAQWLVESLQSMGFEASVRETDGHPAVIAHHLGPGDGAPHLLYYGHYDVQPPDPLDQWDSGPFEPTLVEGPHGRRMVARGAVDDKGQLMMWLEALRAWHAEHGTLPVRATVLLEGEEEVGSRNLRPFLERNRDELAADVCIVSDTTMWDVDTPAVTYMLRGLLYTEITCHGPARDLHSGFYGGAVANPINALARILAGLQADDGRIRVDGFYDDVLEPGEAELAAWRRLDFDEEGFLATAGVSEPGGGERDRSLLERVWSRPSCDVNGIVGGFTGAGAKTVIPTHASRYLEAHTPAGCRCTVEVHSAAPAFRVAPDSPYLRAAQAAMGAVYGRDAVPIGCGGSIPIAAWVREILDIDTLLMGFSLEDDGMHSPNEKFELVCFERGTKSHVMLLDRLRAR